MDQVATRRNVLVLACLLGLTAAVLVGIYVRNATNGGRNGGQVPVVVATQPIAPSTVIEAYMVRKTNAEMASTPQGAAANEQDVIGKVAVAGVMKDQPIMAALVQPKSVSLGLAYAVPAGQRAVTVALDPIIGVAGFLKPGNHVDVLATFNINDGSVTKTVLQDQVLLATGSQVSAVVDPSGKAGEAKEMPNATLAVDPVDAERLILAESKGKLRLALRAQGDIVRVPTPGVNSRALIGYVPPDVGKQKQGSPAAAPAPRNYFASQNRLINPFYSSAPPPLPVVRPVEEPKVEIEVIKGSQIERVPVKT
ncbi:MAG: Flp pilus assembly protein CpaB [Armatimonadota bacterium]|nr:Flp pilus assembly protein CpaB [Armatimonadota bacterium]